MSEAAQLRGRAGVLELFKKCLYRPGPRRHHRKLPVVVLLGVPGSGKTAVLHELRRQWEQVVPLARLDLGVAGMADRPPREIVIELAFQLARKCPQFGRISFQHLMLCLAIARAPIDKENRGQALSDVRAALMANAVTPQHRAAIETLVDALVRGGLLPGQAGMLPRVLLRLSEVVLWRRRLRLAAGLRPRRNGGQPSVNAHDLLVEIGTGDGDAVDELFCQAFLADLRIAYRQGIRAPGRTANCAALLDNIDSPSGERLLDLLARCRAGAQGDPLVVVGTSRTWLSAWTTSWTAPETVGDGQHRQPIRTPEQAGFDDWAQHCARDDGSWGYLVGLRDLTVQEVTDLAATGNHPLGTHAARFAHRLTHGHPLAVRKVLDGLAGSAGLAAMRHVLDAEDPTDRPPVTLACSIRHRMLGEFDADHGVVLANFAVATDLELGAWLLERASQDTAGTTDAIRALRTRLLITTRDGRPALDPWLRRLLLHALAKVGDDDVNGWWTLHTKHRNHHSHLGNEVARLYHELALGEVKPAVDYLGERFKELKHDADAHAWLVELDSITCAPNRLSDDRTPEEQVIRLTAGAGPVNLARLVVAKWLLSDPLADPEEALRGSVRRSLERLAGDAPAGYFVFIREADKYAPPGSVPAPLP